MNTKFFTGKGDAGESSVGPKTLSKGDPLIDLLGSFDELNSWLGFCRVEAKNNFSDKVVDVAATLRSVQESLFIIQAELAAIGFGAMPGRTEQPQIKERKTKDLEKIIGIIDEKLPPLKNFLISGGSELGARLDVGRTMARRLERQAKRYAMDKTLPPAILQYLNRLSSLLFALVRYVNQAKGLLEENPSYQ